MLLLLALAAPAAAGERTITDLSGRQVSLPARIHRLVAVGPGALRLVMYLGAADRVAGIERLERDLDPRQSGFRPYVHAFPPGFAKLPVIGAGGAGRLPNPEMVATCGAALVVAVGIDAPAADLLQAQSGVPVVVLSYGDLGVLREAVFSSLELLGTILDRRERAAELTAGIRRQMDDIRHRTVDIPLKRRPTVYFAGIGYRGSQGITSTEAGYLPGRLANAANVADRAEETGHRFINPEQLLLWNPGVIFLDLFGLPNITRDAARNPAFYAALAAVRQQRTYALMPHNSYNTNVEVALLNAWYIGTILYPERFADIDFSRCREAIYHLFLGIGIPEQPPAYTPVPLVPAVPAADRERG
ncbi:MAG: iron ABC transporter substrate-binding protein [Deltaproteobacteria bacterium]|nr:iron ABC transporter substrate-binding protein [Candidatus Anaeroferrophillacea bacterium]